MAKNEFLEIKSTKDFKEKVKNEKEKPVLVEFYAPWCAPCHALEPVLENVHKNLNSKLNFVKVNINESPDIANKYQVLSIPTILIFKKGEISGTIMGVSDENQIIKKIEDLI